MHLSSRLPKKNYDDSLDGGFLSGEKGERRRPGAGGLNFKNGYHNTMGKKPSGRSPAPDQTTADNSGTNNANVDPSVGKSSAEAVLKLPNIKNQSPQGRDIMQGNSVLKDRNSSLPIHSKQPNVRE